MANTLTTHTQHTRTTTHTHTHTHTHTEPLPYSPHIYRSKGEIFKSLFGLLINHNKTLTKPHFPRPHKLLSGHYFPLTTWSLPGHHLVTTVHTHSHISHSLHDIHKQLETLFIQFAPDNRVSCMHTSHTLYRE